MKVLIKDKQCDLINWKELKTDPKADGLLVSKLAAFQSGEDVVVSLGVEQVS